jgi:mRNA interferase YafQ
MASQRSAADESPPPPLILRPRAEFRRDLKRQQKRGRDLSKLWALVEILRHRRGLDQRNRDHALGGDWKGWRDCHVEPDWILIYKVAGDELHLARTGTHSDLF